MSDMMHCLPFLACIGIVVGIVSIWNGTFLIANHLNLFGDDE